MSRINLSRYVGHVSIFSWIYRKKNCIQYITYCRRRRSKTTKIKCYKLL